MIGNDVDRRVCGDWVASKNSTPAGVVLHQMPGPSISKSVTQSLELDSDVCTVLAKQSCSLLISLSSLAKEVWICVGCPFSSSCILTNMLVRICVGLWFEVDCVINFS